MTAAAREIYDQALSQEADGDLQSAVAGYLRASDMLPHDTDIAYRAASALLRTGALEEAQSRLRRIIFADPTHINARASLGNCQLLLNDLDLAEGNFREVLDRVPDHRNALFGLANVLVKRGRADAAAPFAKQLSELLPGSAAAQTLMAEVLNETGQSTQAVAAYRRLLKSAPDHVPALIGLARTLLKSKRFNDVVSLTVHAAELDPDDAAAFDMMSQALEGRGDLEDSLEAANEAYRLAPANISLLTRMSILNRKLGQHSEALRLALQAIDAEPEARAPANAFGAALAALKFPNQARAVLTASNGKDLDPEIRILAHRLIAAGDEAKKARDKAKRLSAETALSKEYETAPSAPFETDPVDASGKAAALNQDATGEMEKTGQDPNAGQDISAVAEENENTVQSGGPNLKPASFGSKNDEPLPNVLGLSRRDMS